MLVLLRSRAPGFADVRGARGFTLTELMVVVALVGILATVGVASFRRQVASSKTAEPLSVIQAIRAAEEGYRSEHQVYLDVSTSGSWYPSDGVGPVVHSWSTTHTDLGNWQKLGPQVTQPVQFGYLARAGVPGQAVIAMHFGANNPSFATPTEPWYTIEAEADSDQDGVFCRVGGTSFSQELYVEHEGE